MTDVDQSLTQRRYSPEFGPDTGFIAVAAIELTDQRPRKAFELCQTLVITFDDLVDVVLQPGSQVLY
jgi:hypothetical protein